MEKFLIEAIPITATGNVVCICALFALCEICKNKAIDKYGVARFQENQNSEHMLQDVEEYLLIRERLKYLLTADLLALQFLFFLIVAISIYKL